MGTRIREYIKIAQEIWFPGIKDSHISYQKAEALRKDRPYKQQSKINDEFLSACGGGNTDRVIELISMGADVRFSANWGSPLGKAIHGYGNLETIRQLIIHGARAGLQHMYSVISSNNVEYARLLLRSGASKSHGSILTNATRSFVDSYDFNDDVLKTVEELGNRNSEDIEKCREELKTCQEKLENKDDGYDEMRYHSYSQDEPLHYEASTYDIEEIEKLLNNGTDINSTDKYGNNLLHTIFLRYFGGKGGGYTKSRMNDRVKECIKFILSRDIDIDHVNNYGRVPLYYAARYNKELFSFLVEEGAEIHMLDNEDGTFGNVLEILETYIQENKECETEKETLLEEVYEITSKMNQLTEDNSELQKNMEESSGNMLRCIDRKEELENLLRDSESLLTSRNRTIRECEEQKSELERDIAMITSRLVVENSELNDDAIEARERLRLALEAASLNSNSVQLGSLIKDMADFMNSGDMNNYQLAVMESIMEENIRQATSPERVEVLRMVFTKIKNEVNDRKSSIQALKYLESKDFKVALMTKIGAHMRLF